MSAATIFFAVLFYAATAILVAGLAFKIAELFGKTIEEIFEPDKK